MILASAGFSSAAHACTVCGFGQDGSQGPFLLTTALMTMMPLLFVGGAVYYIRRRLKSRSHDEG
ncbi:MAG: hypothetical protein IT288_13140 [Bdellovibrionales bacterium]|nr:hypothetical protein [Bdellovibrionales bacterium]